MCRTRSVTVHPGQPGTALAGSTARAARSRAADSCCSESRYAAYSIPGTLGRPHQRGDLENRRGRHDGLLVLDQLVLPRVLVLDVDGVTADGQHRQDVAAHRVADHAESF